MMDAHDTHLQPKAEKPAPAVAASSSSSAASAAAKTAEKPKPAVSVTPAAVAPAAVTPAAVTPSAAPAVTAGAATTAATTSTGASALVSGSEYEATVQNLMEMGFDREQIVRAMRAAFNNPDRAVEYLMSVGARGRSTISHAFIFYDATCIQGIPESVTNEMSASAAAAPSPGAAGAGGATGASPLAALRGQPQFEQLRQLIQQQPQLLEPILQQLAASNPQLLQVGRNSCGVWNVVRFENNTRAPYSRMFCPTRAYFYFRSFSRIPRR